MLRASAESVIFTNIYGAVLDTTLGAATPVSSVLDIDGLKILLDCGWSADFQPNFLALLHPHLATIDCVLLSSPDIRFCGALPYVLKHVRPGTHIVAPSALVRMATHNVLAHFMARYANQQEFNIALPNDEAEELYVLKIDDIFGAFRAVKEPYGNRTVLRSVDRTMSTRAAAGDAVTAADFDGTAEDLGIGADTAQTGGDPGMDAKPDGEHREDVIAEPIGNSRVLGAHMWRLLYQSDDILYCPEYSWSPSTLLRRHLYPTSTTLGILGCMDFDNGAQLSANLHLRSGQQQVAEPNSSSAYRAAHEELVGQLLKGVTDTLRRERDVFLPVTVAGRGLEVALTLQAMLAEKGIVNYRVVIAHYQAKELLSRVRTMTDLLLEGLVYGEQDAFQNFICCRTINEVKEVPSPKIVFADGEEMHCNLSGELLLHMLQGQNLVLVPEQHHSVTAGSRVGSRSPAAALLDAARSGALSNEGFQYTYCRRTRLSKIELEHYYLAQEALEQKQRERLEHQAAAAASPRRDGGEDEDDWEADYADDDGSSNVNAGAAYPASGISVPASSRTSVKNNAPRLYTPGHQNVFGASAVVSSGNASKFLSFPSPDRPYVLPPNEPYGIPLTVTELQFMRRAAPQRIINDDAPLDLIQVVNDAQVEANIPCKILSESVRVDRVLAVVMRYPLLLYDGLMDAASQRHLLLEKFRSVKTLVPFRGTFGDLRSVVAFCKAEYHNFRGLTRSGAGASSEPDVHVQIPSSGGVPLQLANAVFSYEVEFDPPFLASLQHSLRTVKETRSAGTWDVGLVSGSLACRTSRADGDAADGEAPLKRSRAEGAVANMLTFPSEQRSQTSKLSGESNVPIGSVFVGNFELPALRDYVKRELSNRAEMVRGMLVLGDDGSACVRKDQRGDVTLNCVVGSYMYDARDAIYAQFQQSL